MADKYQHKIAADLRAYAQKLAGEKAAAGEGAPDRMTTGDGDGGITVSKGTIPKDVGEGEVKADQPADGTGRKAQAVPGGSPDRMTTGDGDGGITVSKGSIPKDVGEGEVKTDQPGDGTVRKAATLSKRAAGIRAALIKANPALVAQAEKQAGSTAKPTTAVPKTEQKPENGEKKAGEQKPRLDVSQDTLAKIASAILSTDEGIRFVHDTLEKQAGEAAARAQIQEAIAAAQSYDETEHVKSAALDDLTQKAEAIHTSLAEHGITEEDCGAVIKQAALHQEKLASYDHYMLKAAYAQGMDDAALMAAADDAGGEEGVPAPEEALPMGGEGGLGEEEIMALLEEMLASGEITPEDIEAAVAATEGGGAEGAMPEEGALPPEGAMPEEGALPPEEEMAGAIA